MAKKNSLTSTLKPKVVLNKKTVDTKEVKEAVEQLHGKVKPGNQEATKRFSVDTPNSLYKDIKIHCALEGMAIKDYLLQLAIEDLKGKGRLNQHKSE